MAGNEEMAKEGRLDSTRQTQADVREVQRRLAEVYRLILAAPQRQREDRGGSSGCGAEDSDDGAS